MSFKFQLTEDLQAKIKAKKDKKNVEQVDHSIEETKQQQPIYREPSKRKDVKNERELRSKPKIQIMPFTPEQLVVPSFPVPGMITFEQGSIPIDERYITFYKTINHNQMLMIKAQHQNDRMACSILNDYQNDMNKFLDKELEIKRMQRSFYDIDVQQIEILDLRQKNRIYYEQIETMERATDYFENFFGNNPEVVDDIMNKIFRAIPKQQEFEEKLLEMLVQEQRMIRSEIKIIIAYFYNDLEDQKSSLQDKLGILEEVLRKYDQKIKEYRQKIAKFVGGFDRLLIY